MLAKYLNICEIFLWVHDIILEQVIGIAWHALLYCRKWFQTFYQGSLKRNLCVKQVNGNLWIFVGCLCMKCACVHVHIQNLCGYAAMLVFECATEQCVCGCLTHACQQDGLRQHRLPVGGRAEGGASGREEEVQSQWAGQQTHLPHSAPQDVSPTKYPPLAYCSTTFC